MTRTLEWSNDQSFNMHWSWRMAKTWKTGWYDWMFHTLSQWVAQNIIRTSPLQSLQKSTPKPYMIWYPFEFANTVANSTGVQGAECKIALEAFWKRLKWSNHYHHETPWEKLPKNRIWHGHFGIWAKLDQTKDLREPFAYYYHSKFGRGNMRNNLTIMLTGLSYPIVI